VALSVSRVNGAKRCQFVGNNSSVSPCTCRPARQVTCCGLLLLVVGLCALRVTDDDDDQRTKCMWSADATESQIGRPRANVSGPLDASICSHFYRHQIHQSPRVAVDRTPCTRTATILDSSQLLIVLLKECLKLPATRACRLGRSIGRSPKSIA